jgi:dienelactone hydrolase
MLDARGRLSSNQRAWAERFAQWGFVALTLDSFSPRGAGSICPIPSAERPARPWEDRTADAYAALAWLVRRSDVDPQRIFVAGWSHGGSTVMGVVRPEAPGRLADGPRFRAAIAFYPGCPRPPALNNYRPTMPLLILHGEADDWVPAAPCVDLARHFAHAFIVRTLLYPGAHHGFDAPSTGSCSCLMSTTLGRQAGAAHAGGHEPSRAHAVQETRAYLSGFLSIPLPGPAR